MRVDIPAVPPGLTAEWNNWLKGRPPAVQARAVRYPPGQPYRLRQTGQKVWIYSYTEHPAGVCDTCQVRTSALGILGAEIDPDGTGPAKLVFGVPFTDLEPW
jgi:hypothetical protein